MKTTKISKGLYQINGSEKKVQLFNLDGCKFKGQSYYWSIVDNGNKLGKFKNKRSALLSLQKQKKDYAPQFDKKRVSDTNKPKLWEVFTIMGIGCFMGLLLLSWLGLL